MRRLLILVSAIIFVDTMFFAAVVPILPQLSDEFGLSKTAAGVLSGAYAAGMLVASVPTGLLAARVGARQTMLFGLALLTASGIAFALVDDIVLLDTARFVQGIGGAASWAGALGWLIGAAPRDRRGELIGAAMAVAIGGMLFGPVVGGAAEQLGRGPVFSVVALVGLVLMAATTRLGVPAPAPTRTRAMVGAVFAEHRVRFGMWLTLVPGLLFGTLEVLVPLRMDELGATGVAIAGTFIAAAIAEAITTPIAGRFSDRHGRLFPSAVGLAGSSVFIVLIGLPETAPLLAITLVVATPVMGVLWSPAMAMLSDGAEAAGAPQGLAFGFVNLAWALGHTLGATGGAGIGEAAGDLAAYGILAAICAASFLALVTRGRELSASEVA